MTTKHFLWMGGAIIVLSIIIGVLFKNGCKKEKTPIPLSPTMEEIDKINQHVDDLKFIDSVLKVKASVDKVIDSLKGVVDKQSDQLDVKELKITALSREAALNRKYKDTAAYLINCDSAFKQIGEGIELVNAYRISNISLQNSLDSAIGQGSLAAARKDYLYTELKESFDKVSSSALQMEKDNAKLTRKVQKRFAFGPQSGAMYNFSTRKVEPYLGIGFTWKILSF